MPAWYSSLVSPGLRKLGELLQAGRHLAATSLAPVRRGTALDCRGRARQDRRADHGADEPRSATDDDGLLHRPTILCASVLGTARGPRIRRVRRDQ